MALRLPLRDADAGQVETAAQADHQHPAAHAQVHVGDNHLPQLDVDHRAGAQLSDRRLIARLEHRAFGDAHSLLQSPWFQRLFGDRRYPGRLLSKCSETLPSSLAVFVLAASRETSRRARSLVSSVSRSCLKESRTSTGLFEYLEDDRNTSRLESEPRPFSKIRQMQRQTPLACWRGFRE